MTINATTDIAIAVKKFSKKKLRNQIKVYRNLLKTYSTHLEKYGQQPGQTTGETNRMERELQEYRSILERRGMRFDSGGELSE